MVAVAKEHSSSGFTHITDKKTALVDDMTRSEESSSPDASATVGHQRANISISFFRTGTSPQIVETHQKSAVLARVVAFTLHFDMLNES